MMKNLGFICLLFLFLVSSCREDIRVSNTTENTPDPIFENYSPLVENVDAGVLGFVVDENNQPIPEATVTLNNEIFVTDNFGHFLIAGESMNRLGTVVQVEKDGFFKGSRRFFPVEGEQSRVKIQLLEKTFNQSFNASSGGNIAVEGGASINFPANVIRTESGDPYSGEVLIAAKWLDPSKLETIDQMPGNLQGLSRRLDEMALGTYGMMAVELESETGESLNITETGTATISMPVPQDLLNGAPSEIPLWSYFEDYGLWLEESTATLEGGSYVGEVSHFSFWNCDIPFDYVSLELTLVDDDGLPLNNYLVTLTLNDINSNLITSGSGYTDQNGQVSGFIPSGQVLTMEVFDICGEVLYTQDIGPFNADTDLGTITITGSNINSTTLTGNLIDCDGMPVTNGLVIATFNGQSIYHYTSSSNFSTSFSVCNSTSVIEVVGIDLSNLEQSTVQTATPNTLNDLGDISACGFSIGNFISLTIDGVNKVYLDAKVSVSQGEATYIEAAAQDQSYYIGFGFFDDTTGSFPNQSYVEVIRDFEQAWIYTSGDITFTTFEVTEHGPNVIGSFEGEIADGMGGTIPIIGSFDIEL